MNKVEIGQNSHIFTQAIRPLNLLARFPELVWCCETDLELQPVP